MVTTDPLRSTQPSDRTSQVIDLNDFRNRVKQARQDNPTDWELTRKLVAPSQLPTTLSKLLYEIQQSSLPLSIQESLMKALSSGSSIDQSSVNTVQLKELTGLPASKALRALCLYFELPEINSRGASSLDRHEMEQYFGMGSNPYDLLLTVNEPALLDIGAGDLSFEEELVHQYLPQLQANKKGLTLHALDRLQPGSQFGGVYHANQDRLHALSQSFDQHLRFRFWGGVDIIDSKQLRGLLPHYTMVTCHAPATPTFAYEPTRLSPNIIAAHLQKTKGEFRTIRVNGEEALEVTHRGRTLTFPSWKFTIRGPLALLDFAARRGDLCVMSAIDDEVFWEILAQLVEAEGMRPRNVVFAQENLADIFGDIYQTLSTLKIGARCHLSTLTPVRARLPHVLAPLPRHSHGFRFRHIEIRRGAVFEGMPSSFTARQFSQMSEEPPPWCLILAPDRSA